MKVDRLIVPRWVFNIWRFKITPAGKVLLGGIMFTGLGAVTVMIPVYQLFFLLVWLYVIAWITGWALRPKVIITGSFPGRVTAGQVVTGEFTITNRSRWRPIYDLMLIMIDLPRTIKQLSEDEVVACLPPGESTTIHYSLLVERRGLYELPSIQPHSTFPFNLIRNGSTKHPVGALLVLPSFHPLIMMDVPLSTRHQPGGIALTSNIGESPEYIGNREYVPGEPARRLDFRSWARLGKPVVREYQEEYYCRIALIFDTYVPKPKSWGPFVRLPDGRQGFAVSLGEDGLLRIGADAIMISNPSLEAGISLTAAVADGLSTGEYIIDLFAAGDELYVFRSGRHTAHFENVLEILACADACTKNPFDIIAPALTEELGNISTVICVMLDWDKPRQDFVRKIQESGCSLKLFFVQDQDESVIIPVEGADDVTSLTVQQIQSGSVEDL